MTQTVDDSVLATVLLLVDETQQLLYHLSGLRPKSQRQQELQRSRKVKTKTIVKKSESRVLFPLL